MNYVDHDLAIGPPRTQIVAIGAAGAIDGEALLAMFEQCINTPIAGH